MPIVLKGSARRLPVWHRRQREQEDMKMFGINPLKAVEATMIQATPFGALSAASRNLASSFGQNLIQTLGNALNLPQPLIDAAQSAYAASAGDVAGAVQNSYEAAQGFAEAAGDSTIGSSDFAHSYEDAVTSMGSQIAGGDEVRSARAGGKGGSWLMAMARALGAKADDLADQMQDLADQMSAKNSKPSDSLLFSAKSQEFGLFMNAATNALKTAGESLTTAARKGG